MYKKEIYTRIVICFLFLAGVLSCKNGQEVSSFELALRLPNEPESLHPIFSKSLYAAPIESLILLPVAEYDPISLNYSPVLITAIPLSEKVKESKKAGGKE